MDRVLLSVVEGCLDMVVPNIHSIDTGLGSGVRGLIQLNFLQWAWYLDSVSSPNQEAFLHAMLLGAERWLTQETLSFLLYSLTFLIMTK